MWPETADNEVDAVMAKLDTDSDGFIAKDELKIKKVEPEEPVETPMWLWYTLAAGYVLVGLYVLWDKKFKKHDDHDHHDHHDHHGHDHKDDEFKKADTESQKLINPSV